MTSEIRRIQPADLVRDPLQTPGMTRFAAVARVGLWSGFVRAQPSMASGWHHHGDYDTVIYVLEGAVRFEFGPGGGQSVEGTTGDFLHVPGGLIHRESNPTQREALLVITRAGSGVPVTNVAGPED